MLMVYILYSEKYCEKKNGCFLKLEQTELLCIITIHVTVLKVLNAKHVNGSTSIYHIKKKYINENIFISHHHNLFFIVISKLSFQLGYLCKKVRNCSLKSLLTPCPHVQFFDRKKKLQLYQKYLDKRIAANKIQRGK